MKKILNILVVVALFGFHTSCEENNGYEIKEKQLKVVSSDVLFGAQGGEGSIELTSPAAIVAQSDQTWCTVTISDKKILVTVDTNLSLQNRNANVIISSGGEAISVPIGQQGVVSKGLNVSDQIVPLSGGEFSIDAISDLPIEVIIQDNWLTYELKDNRLFFYADPTDEASRNTVVTLNVNYSEGIVSHSFNVTQTLGYKDFFGIWKFSYTPWGETTILEVDVSIVELVPNKSYTLKSVPTVSEKVANLVLNFVQTAKGQKLVIANNQYLGPITVSSGNCFLYAHMFDAKTGYLTSASNLTYEGIVKMVDAKISLVFQDDGQWGAYVTNGLIFAARTQQDPTSTVASGGYLDGITEIVMTKK